MTDYAVDGATGEATDTLSREGMERHMAESAVPVFDPDFALMLEHHPLPWTLTAHSDPECGVRHLEDANGDEVCSTFMSAETNEATLRALLALVNAAAEGK